VEPRAGEVPDLKALLLRLSEHTAWANARTAASLLALPTPPAAALRLFAHIVSTESLYYRRVRGDDPFPQEFWPALSLHEAAVRGAESGRLLAVFVRERDEEALRRPVRYRDSHGAAYETPIHEMLVHVALHGEHHRGQIAALVRTAGGEPAVTDLIAFVRAHPDVPGR